MRVLTARLTSTAVERVWSHYRDQFTPKRRSKNSVTLVLTFFAKLNMHLLPDDRIDGISENIVIF